MLSVIIRLLRGPRTCFLERIDSRINTRLSREKKRASASAPFRPERKAWSFCFIESPDWSHFPLGYHENVNLE